MSDPGTEPRLMAERATRIVLRPLGNPLPLGFLALAAATLLISALQLDWLQPQEGSQVALILIAFVFPLQLLASILGFLSRDVVAGTGMGILAGTWLSIALITLTGPAGATSDPLGIFLLLAATAMAIPAAASATGLYEITASSAWEDTAGIIGLALCAVAVYAAAAMAIEDVTHRTQLPLGRRDGGAASTSGHLDQQLARIEREAGVREQL